MKIPVTIIEKVVLNNAILVILSLSIIVCAYAGQETSWSDKYEAFMYKEGELNNPISSFSPSDKIFLNIKLHSLMKGTNVVKIYWYNPSGKLQESTIHSFNIREKNTYSFWGWLVLEKGATSRVATANEYNFNYYGKWRLEAFLNEGKIIDRHFTVW